MSSILPPNATDSQKALESATLKRLDFSLEDLTTLPQYAPVQLLPYLAQMFDVNISGLQEAEQRILIANALEIHRYKGTLYAVKKAIEVSFDEAFIMEWFDHDKKPYTFDVKVNIKADTSLVFNASKFVKARELINSSKNARSHFDNFIIELPSAVGDIQKAETANFDVTLESKLIMRDIDNNTDISAGTNFNIDLSSQAFLNKNIDNDMTVQQATGFNIELQSKVIYNKNFSQNTILQGVATWQI